MRVILLTVVLTLWLVGCQDLTEPKPFVELDRAYFDCEVTDVITKTCAGLRCHGDPARYYTIFTRNRLRFGVTEEDRGSKLQPIESEYDYAATVAQVDQDDPANSLLLLKPLEQTAGGYFHRGAEIFGGGDVFRDREDRDFQKLEAWVNGETADPSCRDGIN